METKEIEKYIGKKLKSVGHKNIKAKISSEFIGFRDYSAIELVFVQILFNRSWLQEKYFDHYSYWGYDKEVELANIVVRAYCVLMGTPLDEKDLPFRVAPRMMMVENLLIGVQYRKKETTLFGEEWMGINTLTGPVAKLIHGNNT